MSSEGQPQFLELEYKNEALGHLIHSFANFCPKLRCALFIDANMIHFMKVFIHGTL